MRRNYETPNFQIKTKPNNITNKHNTKIGILVRHRLMATYMR